MIRKAIRMIIMAAMRSIFLNPNYIYYDLLFHFLASLCNKKSLSYLSSMSYILTPSPRG